MAENEALKNKAIDHEEKLILAQMKAKTDRNASQNSQISKVTHLKNCAGRARQPLFCKNFSN
ncbi:MAG: hypothetical protein IPJ39_14000 [Saprospiraceae bacterium]|nr:hypothetical protein [Saprospiraceae bacterium]